MAVTRYYTVNGRIRGESTGGVRTNYLPDALGSVTATVDESGTVVNTYRYKPAGAQLSKTGIGADPKFLWNGANGYRRSGGSLSYVRARHYDSAVNAWTSIGSLWPHVPAYSYARLNPVTYAEPSGNNTKRSGASASIKLRPSAPSSSSAPVGVGGNCFDPESCSGDWHKDVGKECTCKGKAGLINLSDETYVVKHKYCSGSSGNCIPTNDCDYPEEWKMVVKWLQCEVLLTDEVCHMRGCELYTISRTRVPLALCGCYIKPMC